MADIAFLLIIFFMLATTFTRDRKNIDLPHSLSRSEIPSTAITLTIDQNNKLFWDGFPIAYEDIDNRVRDVLHKNKYRPFVVKADRYVTFAVIDRVLQILTNAGVINLNLPTKSEKKE